MWRRGIKLGAALLIYDVIMDIWETQRCYKRSQFLGIDICYGEGKEFELRVEQLIRGNKIRPPTANLLTGPFRLCAN